MQEKQPLDGEKILNYLKELGKRLEESGRKKIVRVIVLGGAYLILSDIIHRTTEDVDIEDLREVIEGSDDEGIDADAHFLVSVVTHRGDRRRLACDQGHWFLRIVLHDKHAHLDTI